MIDQSAAVRWNGSKRTEANAQYNDLYNNNNNFYLNTISI